MALLDLDINEKYKKENNNARRRKKTHLISHSTKKDLFTLLTILILIKFNIIAIITFPKI